MENKFNYRNGSIVNLMSSIAKHFGKKSIYKPLKALEKIKFKKNILLIVFDGLGYNYMNVTKPGTFFEKAKIQKITSVFPPTTASAITSFMTGVAPQQHGVTGWFVQLKEIGAATVLLPFCPRFGPKGFENSDISIRDLIRAEPFIKGLKADCFSIIPRVIKNSEYTKNFMSDSTILPYRSMRGFVNQIKKVLLLRRKKGKYIYAYSPIFDAISHELGGNSLEAYIHLREIESAIISLKKQLKDTTMIITADHGMIDTDASRTIDLTKHPKFMDCLSMPVSGERRSAYCYVRPSKENEFKSYFKKHFRKQAYLIRSEEMLNLGFFGLYKQDPRLIHRVGDYMLIAKKNYCFVDSLLRQKPNQLIGNHAGISEDEIFVPLIVL